MYIYNTSSRKALTRERYKLSKLMKKLSKDEREDLYLRWDIGLNTKQRRLQLAHLLWSDYKDMGHVSESASLVGKLHGFGDMNLTSTEMFGINFGLKSPCPKKSSLWKRSLVSLFFNLTNSGNRCSTKSSFLSDSLHLIVSVSQIFVSPTSDSHHHTILSNEEKKGGLQRPESSFVDFRSFVAEAGLFDLQYSGDCSGLKVQTINLYSLYLNSQHTRKKKNSGDKEVEFHGSNRENKILPSSMSSQTVSEAIECRVSGDENSELIREITDLEIKSAAFSIHADKAPGPDGFSAAFFQANCWN